MIFLVIILIVDSVVTSVTAVNNVTISDEAAESHHIGLIRPTKDLSIWIDEDQVFYKYLFSISVQSKIYLKRQSFSPEFVI